MDLNEANDLPQRIADLLEKASHLNREGRSADATALIDEARRLAPNNVQASAEIDLFCAIALLEQEKREEGLQALASILLTYAAWLKTNEGHSVYEAVQLQRAFSFMHLEKYLEARPLLEEATEFELDAEVRSDLHCHLGRCYHELSQYALAKEQFEAANALWVNEEWQSAFHYCFGYTLYRLGEFKRAKREFILCLQSGASGPEEWMRYAMLAATSRKLGEHTEARTYDEKAKSLKP